jgi:hypothetical protein
MFSANDGSNGPVIFILYFGQCQKLKSKMAVRRSFFCRLRLSTMLSKLIFLGYFYFICATESTVFTEEGNTAF